MVMMMLYVLLQDVSATRRTSSLGRWVLHTPWIEPWCYLPGWNIRDMLLDLWVVLSDIAVIIAGGGCGVGDDAADLNRI